MQALLFLDSTALTFESAKKNLLYQEIMILIDILSPDVATYVDCVQFVKCIFYLSRKSDFRNSLIALTSKSDLAGTMIASVALRSGTQPIWCICVLCCVSVHFAISTGVVCFNPFCYGTSMFQSILIWCGMLQYIWLWCGMFQSNLIWRSML